MAHAFSRWALHSPFEADRVVEGLGAVHELRPAGCELDHPAHAALARADVIVADDKALALPLGGRIRVVDLHLVSRPDVDARDASSPGRAGAGEADRRSDPLRSSGGSCDYPTR
jgi:hypothetical protein